MIKIINAIKSLKRILEKMCINVISKIRKKRLKCHDFTIISNNCFGGIFYKQNEMQYLTPTCGLFFMANEYIKFIYDLDRYLNGELIEITIEESNYKEYLKMIKYSGIIGKIYDLEICFLHYTSFSEAKEKWERRKRRINKDKIIYKFNDQNLCDYELLKKFNDFKADNKICFTSKNYEELNTIQLTKYKSNTFVLSEAIRKDYNKDFNMYNYINKCFK